MTIGFVRQKGNKFKDETVKWLELSVRVPLGSFSATLSKVKEKQADNSPDYNLFWSPNRRGESFDRVKIGSLWMKTSEKGNPYMSGYIESPVFPNGKIYISIVKYTPLEGMQVQDIMYNVLWSPEQKQKDDYSTAYDNGGYAPAPTQTHEQPAATTTTTHGVPVEIDIDEENMPF